MKLGVVLSDELEERLRPILPWGTKAGVVEELLWQLVERNDPEEVMKLLQSRDRRKQSM